MITEEFLNECIDLGVIVIPFMGHSGWHDGNVDDSTKVGIRFVCAEYDSDAVLLPGEFWLDLEMACPKYKLVADTPELALELYKKNKIKELQEKDRFDSEVRKRVREDMEESNGR